MFRPSCFWYYYFSCGGVTDGCPQPSLNILKHPGHDFSFLNIQVPEGVDYFGKHLIFYKVFGTDYGMKCSAFLLTPLSWIAMTDADISGHWNKHRNSFDHLAPSAHLVTIFKQRSKLSHLGEKCINFVSIKQNLAIFTVNIVISEL